MVQNMDIDSEIKLLKEYYEGLDAISTNAIPPDISADIEADFNAPDTDELYIRVMQFACRVALPLINLYGYISNNRLLHTQLPSILPEVNEFAPVLPAATIYQKLNTLNSCVALELISTIQCGSMVQHQLQDAYLEHNQQTFCDILTKHNCQLQAISHLCRLLWDDYRPAFTYPEEKTDLLFDIMSSQCKAQEDLVSPQFADSVHRIHHTFHQLLSDDTDNNYYQYLNALDDYNHALVHDIALLYIGNTDDFKVREKQLIDNILGIPEAEEVVDAIIQEIESDDIEIPEVGSEPNVLRSPIAFQFNSNQFDLPPNFWFQRCDSALHHEYFDCHEVVLKEGVEKLTVLLNYLGENDYIPNDTTTKQLLAYRLTGKGRPDEVPAIEWHGHNNNPYELIYLVRYLCTRGDYAKMRQFFTGPQWVKSRDSSYAKSAAYDFRHFLHDIYPDICPL